MAALRPADDWSRITLRDHLAGLTRAMSSLGRPPAAVIAATVLGWFVIGYTFVSRMARWL